MRAVNDAIAARLIADAALTALGLATYAGEPAVIVGDWLPPGVEPPFIQVGGPILDTGGPFDTKNSVGRQWTRDITIIDRNTPGDTSRVEDMAERVRDLFQRKHADIAASGWATMVSAVAGPTAAQTDETLVGRIVTLTLSAMAE